MMMIIIIVIAIIIFLLLAATVSVPVIVPCLSYWLIILSLTALASTLHSSCFFVSTTLPTWATSVYFRGTSSSGVLGGFFSLLAKRKIISVAVLSCDESNGQFWRATGIRTVDPRGPKLPQSTGGPYIAVSLRDVPVRNHSLYHTMATRISTQFHSFY